MERDGYRETLGFLTERTNKVILNKCEVAELLGVSRNTVTKRYNIGRDGISVPELAKRIVAQDALTRRRTI